MFCIAAAPYVPSAGNEARFTFKNLKFTLILFDLGFRAPWMGAVPSVKAPLFGDAQGVPIPVEAAKRLMTSFGSVAYYPCLFSL